MAAAYGRGMRVLRALVVVLALGAAGSAQASADATVRGVQSRVGCLSTALCVLGGSDSRGTGDLVTVRGAPPDGRCRCPAPARSRT